ncbi:beta family protein [Pseudomonas sp. EL_65y_Pfl2_R95]|uniref:beta family protein n=1 Tax=Pseudomonas sp. EL_65y_Pfl2_R95 TaxID=3088698 RepID=UPI0030DB878E
MQNFFLTWSYIPILAIKAGEITALDQLPDKEKDNILPLFPIRGWTTAHKLSSAIEKIKSCIGDRQWIADIDETFLSSNKTFMFTGSYPNIPVYKEIESLLNPENGYANWCSFIEQNKTSIPCIRHENGIELRLQIKNLSALGRGLVLRINPNESNFLKHAIIIQELLEHKEKNILIIYDLEAIDVNFNERRPLLEKYLAHAKQELPEAALSISASSFPSSFSGQKVGEHTIYERLLFNSLEASQIYNPLIYSDRGSARARKQDGGGGTPPPRIDYPLKKDWKFVRREVSDNIPNSKSLRKAAYIEIAKEIIDSGYWIPELRLWGTQQIELTAEGNEFAIYSAQKSTAARINIHLFTQLYYNSKYEYINTDEEWVD